MNESYASKRPSGDNQRAKGPSVLVTACDQCYRCKVRCSSTREACDRCLHNGSICTYSLGKPLGKPPKNGRGRTAKDRTQRAKRLRCSTDNVQEDGLELPESRSPSSSGSIGVFPNRRVDNEQKPSLSDIATRTGESRHPIAEPPQAFPGETAGDTALLGFDMDMQFDLDLDSNLDTSHFSFFMDSPRPRTPALGQPGRHPTPLPLVIEPPTFDISASVSASITTPPSSLSSAAEALPVPAQLWTPAFTRLVSDLYTAPHSTVKRFDNTLLLARQGLDFIVSYLPDLSFPIPLGSTSPKSLLVCVIIAQEVLASYTFLKSQISSRLLSSNLTSGNSRPTSASPTLLPGRINEAAGEGVYIGSFEVEGIESQCQVMKAIVNLEIGRFEKALTRLEAWTEELSKEGEEEGKLAHLILVALKARLFASS